MLLLCSQSPRRKELFEKMGLAFDTVHPQLSETVLPGELPLAYLERITIEKARSIQNLSNSDPKNLYVSSDTIVVFEGNILQKPENAREAIEMLLPLAGNQHTVYSGLCLLQEKEIIWDYDTTQIQFKDWSRKSIERYVANSQPFDKAGGYGIQDPESPVLSYSGSYTNVMGFPIRKFYKYFSLWQPFMKD